jgi:uncharacterized protein YqeY
MTLKTRIQDDMKDAMRAKDAARLGTIRLLLAAIKQREVDERKEMADADVLAVVDKMIKQRKDSVTQFEAGKREDLASAERAEIAVLQGYLPAQASDAEIDAMRRGPRAPCARGCGAPGGRGPATGRAPGLGPRRAPRPAPRARPGSAR